ncbi:MAG: arsenite S-adenosylmethyltransferase, partial [Chloroflexota bacterium]
ISDIVTTGDIPAEVRASLDEWAHCIAGALSRDVYLAKMRAAGFRDITVLQETTVFELVGWRANMASIKVRAVKP